MNGSFNGDALAFAEIFYMNYLYFLSFNFNNVRWNEARLPLIFEDFGKCIVSLSLPMILSGSMSIRSLLRDESDHLWLKLDSFHLFFSDLVCTFIDELFIHFDVPKWRSEESNWGSCEGGEPTAIDCVDDSEDISKWYENIVYYVCILDIFGSKTKYDKK